MPEPQWAEKALKFNLYHTFFFFLQCQFNLCFKENYFIIIYYSITGFNCFLLNLILWALFLFLAFVQAMLWVAI